MTALETRFWAALRRLEAWHSDSLKAQSFDGPQTSPTKPGSIVLRATPYPHFSYWTNEWRKARNDGEREEVLWEMDKEWRRLSQYENSDLKVDSKKYWVLDSGQYVGVQYREVAAELELESATVYRWRADRGLNPHNGREKAA